MIYLTLLTLSSKLRALHNLMYSPELHFLFHVTVGGLAILFVVRVYSIFTWASQNVFPQTSFAILPHVFWREDIRTGLLRCLKALFRVVIKIYIHSDLFNLGYGWNKIKHVEIECRLANDILTIRVDMIDIQLKPYPSVSYPVGLLFRRVRKVIRCFQSPKTSKFTFCDILLTLLLLTFIPAKFKDISQKTFRNVMITVLAAPQSFF